MTEPRAAGGAADAELEQRLSRERPLPPARLRGRLGRVVADHTAGRPRAGWASAAIPALVGLALLAVVALGVTGVGPIAP